MAFGTRPAGGAKGAQDASRQGVAGPGLTPADLVAARRRDPDAIARIYRAYAPALYRFFMAALGDRHTAEDLTGTVFADAITALPNFKGPLEALGGWLFRIARHDLYDHRRHEARARTEHLDDVLDEAALAQGAPDPQDLAVERLERSRLWAALEELSPDQREVLLLRMAAGLTAPEVAATLGKTTGAVKALQHRGLASLTRVLDLRGPTEEAQQRAAPRTTARPATTTRPPATVPAKKPPATHPPKSSSPPSTGKQPSLCGALPNPSIPTWSGWL